jgi:hypothetical protein
LQRRDTRWAKTFSGIRRFIPVVACVEIEGRCESLHRKSTPKMSISGATLMEDHMSVTVKLTTGDAESVNSARERSSLWTIALILGVIVACAIGAWFYVDAPLLDASMVGP